MGILDSLFHGTLASPLAEFEGGSRWQANRSGDFPTPHSPSHYSPERSDELDGAVPVFYAPELSGLASRIRLHLDAGAAALTEILGSETPSLRVVVVANGDWENAPRENERPYPPGLPYFTRSTEPPALVFPEELSLAIQPRTEATLPLTVWHELAHAFLLRNPVVRTPAWLREFIPQAASAAVAKREGVPLEEHLARIEHPGFTARTFRSPATAEGQMAFQNLLLSLGAAAIKEFGESFLNRLVHELWNEEDVVNGERAEAMLAEALGSSGRTWLEGREEF